MNILFINSCYYGGGAEKVNRQMYYGNKTLKSNNFLCIGTNEGDYDLPKDKNIFTLYPKRFMEENLNKFYEIVKNNYLINLFSISKIIFLIKKNKIDLIHINNLHVKYLGIYDIMIISKICPVVLTLHDMWAITGHCAYPGSCKNWTSGCKTCKNLDIYPSISKDNSSKIYKNKKNVFVNSNITYVTPSKWLYDITKKSFLKSKTPFIINNGVNLEQFKFLNKEMLRKKYKLPLDKNYILFLTANIDDKRKGLSFLLAALNKLQNSEKYIILLAGKKLKDKKITNKFKVVDFGYVVDDQKLNEIYALADVFILPSLEDNFPCVTLESMASGTPIIAFETGGIGEQIDGETGYIVKDKTANGLMLAIEKMFLNKKNLALMSEKCRYRAEVLYDENIMLNKYKDLYKNIIKNRKERENVKL